MKLHHLLFAGAAVAMLAGCADYGDYADTGYPGDTAYIDYGYGPAADVAFDGWYDGFYGPIYDGYWDNDVFFYRTSPDATRFSRGDVTHFRHDAAPGFSHMRGMTHARTTPPPPTH